MIGLDTNVLVRYIVKDDKRQSEKAVSFIRNAVLNGDKLYINCVVICELIWVLGYSYQFNKHDITQTIGKILTTKQFEIEHKEIVRNAIIDYSLGKGDLPDYLIGLINEQQGCIHTVTFDRALKNSTTFTVFD